MEATADRPMITRGGDAAWYAKRIWAVAFLVPFALHIGLEARDFEYEERGSGCRALTPVGEHQFADAVVNLQVALAVWALAGIALVTFAWLRRLESSPGAWLTLAGWLVPGAVAVVVAWYGPAGEAFGKLLLLVYGVPVFVVGSTVVMTLGLAWRRSRRRARFPVGVLVRSQTVLLAVLFAGVSLGGNGEVPIC